MQLLTPQYTDGIPDRLVLPAAIRRLRKARTVNNNIWQNRYATSMNRTGFRRRHGARLLRCIQAYHWPAIRIDRCRCTSSATWWSASLPPAGNPELGRSARSACLS